MSRDAAVALPFVGGAVVKRGFSLIEVMAASAIFGVGLAAIFSAFATATAMYEHQRHMTFAIHLTEAKMEELLLRPSSDNELVAGTVFGPAWFDGRGFPAAAGCPGATSGTPAESTTCRYRVTWSSAPVAGLKVSLRDTTVTTSWNEHGVLKVASFSTQRN